MTSAALNRPNVRGWLVAAIAGLALLTTACGDSDEGESTTPETAAPASEAGTDAAEAPADTEASSGVEDGADEGPVAMGSGERDFSALAPPAGDTIVVGMVNTEGPSGLNFPEIRTMAAASVDYLNEHGGLGGRPIQLEVCVADSSPESSQACAQELAGKNVEMVFLGLDLFPDYPTYDASGIPVVGSLPLFPADYAAEAIYLNGGNATLGASIAGVAAELFEATNVAIVSADNAGANGSELAAIAALDAAGISYRSIKGSDNETDAGFQGLVREALSDDPDVLISLYGDAGCIGMMRGRAALGSDVPVIASNTCANGEVLAAAGDDALGWYFTAGGDQPVTAENTAVREAVAPEVGVAADEVILSNLGLGGLSPVMFFTIAAAANDLAAGGAEVTGPAIYDFAKANESGNLRIFPDGGTLQCGASPSFSSVCGFTLFIGTYVGDGRTEIVDGFDQFDALPYLP